MFFINQQQDAKLSFGNPDTQNKGAKSVVEAKSQAKIPEYIKNLYYDICNLSNNFVN